MLPVEQGMKTATTKTEIGNREVPIGNVKVLEHGATIASMSA